MSTEAGIMPAGEVAEAQAPTTLDAEHAIPL